jgi:hypothetical protein
MHTLIRQFIAAGRILSDKLQRTAEFLSKSQEQPTEPKHKHETSRKEWEDPTPEIRSILHALEAIERNQRSSNSSQDNHQNRNLFVSCAGVFVVLAYTTVTILNWRSFEKSNRAILYPRQVISGGRQHVHFYVKNIGASAALQVTGNVGQNGEEVVSKDKAYPTEATLEKLVPPVEPTERGFILPPGEERDLGEVGPPLENSDVMSGKYSRVVFLHYGYKDIFGKTWHIYSCAWWYPSGPHYSQCFITSYDQD